MSIWFRLDSSAHLRMEGEGGGRNSLPPSPFRWAKCVFVNCRDMYHTFKYWWEHGLSEIQECLHIVCFRRRHFVKHSLIGLDLLKLVDDMCIMSDPLVVINLKPQDNNIGHCLLGKTRQCAYSIYTRHWILLEFCMFKCTLFIPLGSIPASCPITGLYAHAHAHANPTTLTFTS